jgi:cytochrome bd-type quinol oxidase subunit 2
MDLVWLAVLATCIVVYVLPDGVDPGVGILFGFGPHEGVRPVMLRVIAPVHQLPFYLATVIFAAAFGTLAISFWPCMIPFAVTIDAAAVPLSGLASRFWTGVLVFSLIITYALRNDVIFGAGSGRILSKKRSTVLSGRGEGE